ncbi:aminoglycoside phosphotransferase family protein [Paenibacillus wynnii]|uniref:aminoglycoside phosphotransferase family protein n=1 Tax=Paenibacillus wynnii TaxID=268407 RepID=UPI000690751A|nr:phosphotransferase [Paenibacillus wynnii]
MSNHVTGIPHQKTWKKLEPVLKGWSSDLKYEVESGDGQRLLLRLSAIEQFDARQAEYNRVKVINQLDFAMSRAIDFGLCNEGRNTYMLLTWVEGLPLEECLLSLPVTQQYQLGVQAGQILKQIHSIPPPAKHSDWEQQLRTKVLSRVEKYESCPYRVPGDETAIAFVKKNIGQLSNMGEVYRHGDYHIGNLLYTDQGQIGVIDFNRCDSGDYVEEFYKLQSFDREWSIPFARGKIDGYFEGAPPDEFWTRQALYVAYSSLFSIVWAIPFGASEVEGMIDRCKVAFEDYEYFKRVIPRWYAEGSEDPYNH